MNEAKLTADSPKEQRIGPIITALKKRHPDAHCELDYESPLQLLVATILSAQCTDVRVNMVTPELFQTYPTAADLAAAPREAIEAIIRSTGFYRSKAKYIQESAARITHEFGGDVPADMRQLLSLKGVARKTANVVLGEAFGIAEGVVVDTHVRRLSQRLGLTEENDPKKIERALMALVPKEDWIIFSHLMIFHGRRVCDARKPDCAHCSLSDLCPSAFAT